MNHRCLPYPLIPFLLVYHEKCASGAVLIQSGRPWTRDIRILCQLLLRLVTTFFSLIPYHHWIVKTSVDVCGPRIHDSKAKNIEKWANHGPHAAFAAKNT